MSDVLIREENRVLSKICHIAIDIDQDNNHEIIGFMIQKEESDNILSTFFEY